MMCEECGIRQAKFHLMKIVNDERTERNLCAVCMAKYQKQLPGIDLTNLAGILNNILENQEPPEMQADDESETSAVCEQCGKRFTRQRTWSKTREKWYCTCGCKNTVYIDDNLFYGQILSIINHVIENPEILRVSSSPNECYTPSLEVLRAEKEADRMAERKNVDFLPIKKAIYTNISDKFDCCALDRAKAFTNALEQYFSEQSVSEAINIQILRDTVERIYVNKNGKVIIGFLNGCRISKEDSYGNSSTETKNSY